MKNGKFLWPQVTGILALALALLFTACPDPTGSTEPTGSSVNKASLNSAITEAEAAKTNVSPSASNDGAGLATEAKWVSLDAWDVFNTAINTAKGVRDNASASQAQVDSAVNTLKAAITAFTTAIQIKTQMNTLVLNAKIAEAENARDSVTVEETAAEVAYGAPWANAEQKATLQTAIDTARGALTAATQDAVDNAVIALDTVLSNFNTAVTNNGPGGKQTGFTQEQFATLIADAKAAITGVVSSTKNGDDVSPLANWVTQTVWVALDTAITTAEGVLDFQDSDYMHLRTPLTDFNIAIRLGSTPDREALQAAIDDADSAKEDVVRETNADDVPPGSAWVTQAQWDALVTPYTDALAVKNNDNATKNDVAAAKDALDGAVGIFNTAKTTNGPGSTPDTAALNAAIQSADSAKAGVVTAASASMVPSGSAWVTEAQWNALDTPYNAAVTTSSDTNATKNVVTAATSALTNAIGVFNTAKSANGPGTAVNSLTITGLGAIYKNGTSVYVGVLPSKEFDPSSTENFAQVTVTGGSLTMSLPTLGNGLYYSGFSSDGIIVFISKTAADFAGVPISIPYNTTNFEPLVWPIKMSEMDLPEGMLPMSVKDLISSMAETLDGSPTTYAGWKNAMKEWVIEDVLGEDYANAANVLNIAMFKDEACTQEVSDEYMIELDTVIYTKYALATIMEKAMAE
jgi:hypothetical protein